MDPINELTSITQILHLTHHRNHNQHRLAKWYKSFSQLRRQTAKLKTELEALQTAISFSSSSEESKYAKAAREKVEERVEFMKVHLLPRWYLAFGNLVADNQYAVLGLMLTATLARVRSVLLIVGKEEVVEEGVVTKEVPRESGVMVSEEIDYDLGEVVKRDEFGDFIIEHAESMLEPTKVTLTVSPKKRLFDEEAREEELAMKVTPPKPRKKKKLRKKGDAFDDLFDSLI